LDAVRFVFKSELVRRQTLQMLLDFLQRSIRS